MKKKWIEIQEKMLDDSYRYLFQFYCVYAALCVVSLFMTLMNIAGDKGFLTVTTAVFSVYCALVLALSLKGAIGRIAMKLALVFSAYILLGYFIISGNPDGFSALWTALIPTCGLLLLGRREGTIMTAGMFVIILFFFWTPWGNDLLQYEYSPTFLDRYPILYVALYFVSLVLESVRVTTSRALDKSLKEYQYLSTHDALTGLKNRNGFKYALESNETDRSFLIADVDKFKEINDTYGHLNGDLILEQIAKRLLDCVGERGDICRWGGEEFAVLISPALTDEQLRETAQEMCDAVTAEPFHLKKQDIAISISVGAAADLNQADEALYIAKESGRNCVHIYNEEEMKQMKAAAK